MKKIKDIPEFSRPREKIIEKGVESLTDTELIAVILGSGTRQLDVMTLSSKISSLINKHGMPVPLDTFMSIDGIGTAKACSIIAGFELARRHILKETVVIKSPNDVLPLLLEIVDKHQEYFICFSLNGANELIKKRIVTVGLLNNCQVHPREVFADVITDRAASVIFAHNHPSGELTPSKSDLNFQNQLTEAAKILGISILDHIIVSKKGYCSFQEQGLL